MNLFRISERFMAMNDETWARHTNPWSGLTRFTVLPLICLAIWSRVWLGWWCLALVALALAWNWWNPRAFGPPDDFDSWFSKGVLGERVFLTYPEEVPAHHYRVAHVLTYVAMPGAVIMVYGLWALWWEGVVFGMFLTILPKVWFVDRMVWLLEDWQRAGRKVPGVDDV